MKIISIKYHSTDNNHQDKKTIVWFEVKVEFEDDQESSELYSGQYGVVLQDNEEPKLVDCDGCPQHKGTNWIMDRILDALGVSAISKGETL